MKSGYPPTVIVIKQGQRVRLDFYHGETSSYSEQVILGDFGIARDLPAYKTTPIVLTPQKVGEFIFTCVMNMLRGKIIVQRKSKRNPPLSWY
jgi:plastocyanin domain-containing protein